MRIVLVQPEIPGNAGNIARLSAALGASLHLIKPLGFSLEDRYLKRAGLDYWHLLDIHIHENYEDFSEKFLGGKIPYFLSTKAESSYVQPKYKADDVLVFGRETAGLSEEFLGKYPGNLVRIPMIESARSLNLSNSVAIVAYEVARQNLFKGMKVT
jgi:Predicted rRNA methylase (SpoU class)